VRWFRRWGVAVPGRNRSVPRRNRSVPGRNRSVPRRNRSVPGRNRSVPGRNRSAPGRNRSAPRRNRSVPRRNRSVPGTVSFLRLAERFFSSAVGFGLRGARPTVHRYKYRDVRNRVFAKNPVSAGGVSLAVGKERSPPTTNHPTSTEM
jgi:hypothetical protein